MAPRIQFPLKPLGSLLAKPLGQLLANTIIIQQGAVEAIPIKMVLPPKLLAKPVAGQQGPLTAILNPTRLPRLEERLILSRRQKRRRPCWAKKSFEECAATARRSAVSATRPLLIPMPRLEVARSATTVE